MKLSTRCQKFADVCAEIDALEGKIKSLKATKAEISNQLVEAMTNEGVEKMTLDVGSEQKTFYIHKNLWAKLKEGLDTEDGVEALKRAKLKDLLSLSYNSSKLSSYLRELEKEGKTIPKPVLEAFHFNPTFEIRARTSGG